MLWEKVGFFERRRVQARLGAHLGHPPWCLRGPPPRDLVLTDAAGAVIDEPLLRTGFATRGVAGGGTVVFVVGHTLARLPWQGPEGPVTVLVDGPLAMVFDGLAAWEEVDLVTLLGRAQDATSARRAALLAQAIDMVDHAIQQDPTAFAERAHTMAEAWTDNREPRRWPAELRKRLAAGKPVMPQLAVLSPALPEARVRLAVEG